MHSGLTPGRGAEERGTTGLGVTPARSRDLLRGRCWRRPPCASVGQRDARRGAAIPVLLLVSTVPALFVVLRYAHREHEWRLRVTPEERRAYYCESGTHSVIVARGGLYASSWQAQMRAAT